MKIHIITGQTATGKTSYALNLAYQLDGELINCDSRQIYKHLDIITGKDLTGHSFHLVQKKDNFQIGYYEIKKDNKNARIWLYDIADPKENFSSFDYQQCALIVINDIISRNKTPILVGGTYFYLKHLLYGVETENIAPDWSLRSELENKSIEELQHILKVKSSEIYNKLNDSDKNNPQRLIRKIEIASSGRKITQEKDNCKTILQDEVEVIGLQFKEKEELHTKIEKRVNERLHQGAVQEVEQLIKNGYTETDPGLRTIGYQQIIQYLKNEISQEEAITNWITKEKQYAKRQYTFMKKDPNISWKFI